MQQRRAPAPNACLMTYSYHSSAPEVLACVKQVNWGAHARSCSSSAFSHFTSMLLQQPVRRMSFLLPYWRCGAGWELLSQPPQQAAAASRGLGSAVQNQVVDHATLLL